MAGYPIRAERFTAQIRALLAAMTGRGVGVRTTSATLGHVLGAVLDVGSFVLIDVILRRAAPRDRVEALVWAGRAFSFAPLWTNLNVLTVTTITLTGVSYGGLLAASLPFVLIGLPIMLLFAQREKSEAADAPGTPLDRGAAAVLLYPVLLVAAVALVNALVPGLSLTATIALTVAVVVALIAGLATVMMRQPSPCADSGERHATRWQSPTPSSPSSGRRASSCSRSKLWAPSRRLGSCSPLCLRASWLRRWRSWWDWAGWSAYT
jgi:hypothetical protein